MGWECNSGPMSPHTPQRTGATRGQRATLPEVPRPRPHHRDWALRAQWHPTHLSSIGSAPDWHLDRMHPSSAARAVQARPPAPANSWTDPRPSQARPMGAGGRRGGEPRPHLRVAGHSTRSTGAGDGAVEPRTGTQRPSAAQQQRHVHARARCCGRRVARGSGARCSRGAPHFSALTKRCKRGVFSPEKAAQRRVRPVARCQDPGRGLRGRCVVVAAACARAPAWVKASRAAMTGGASAAPERGR